VIRLGWAILSGATMAAGAMLVSTVWRRPSLVTVIASLDSDRSNRSSGSDLVDAVAAVARRVGGVDDRALATLGRSRRQHTLLLAIAVAVGVGTPLVALGVGQAGRLISVPMVVPPALAAVGSLVAVAVVQRSTLEAVTAIRGDLRHQLTAYLDVVTMLIAGDTGHETALEQAARIGDGRLFAELRRSLREFGARGQSLVGALDDVARRCGLDELEQIAAALGLAAADGAPVVRSLTARTATLRSAAASQQEMEARLRTSRLTGPIVGMSLVFMAVVVYPALAVT
jgi:Flp pilus assembly protein TadB